MKLNSIVRYLSADWRVSKIYDDGSLELSLNTRNIKRKIFVLVKDLKKVRDVSCEYQHNKR